MRKLNSPRKSLNAPVVFPLCRLEQVREQKRQNLAKTDPEAAKQFTQPAIAKQLEISPSTLWKIELGTNVKLSFARKIAKLYGKTIEFLWPET